MEKTSPILSNKGKKSNSRLKIIFTQKKLKFHLHFYICLNVFKTLIFKLDQKKYENQPNCLQKYCAIITNKL
jgi:hypothetical protein